VLSAKAFFGSLRFNIRNRLATVLPPRELHLHDAKGAKVLRIGTRAQLGAAGAVALTLGWTGIATVNMLTTAIAPSGEAAQLAHMRTRVAAMQADINAVKHVAGETANRLEARQKFLTALLSGDRDVARLAELMPKMDGVEAAHGRYAAVVSPLAALEGRQLAFVAQATSAAMARYQSTTAQIRRLGLDPARFYRQSQIVTGMGGPFQAADAPGAPLANADPQFKALFVSWTKLDQLEKGLSSVPSQKPVNHFSFSSGFGVRYDPFNGNMAMHAGIDMAGPIGEPIYASADGVVDRAGVAGGYGNLIELDHGKGIQTRYGHLSAILVHPGQRVQRGEMIGRMGSTGRSTGSHLHYEVRIDGRAVNPVPFLQSSDFLLASQERGARSTGQGGPESPIVD
jgi:murein DD-endopeptidase MepM/ murein hydrolase activator NlpD